MSASSEADSVDGRGRPPGKLPQLNHSTNALPDLGKTVLVAPGSQEADLVARGLEAARVTNGFPHGGERGVWRYGLWLPTRV